MTRTSARALAVATALIVGGALAGCGSDEPSAADYRTDVNAICTAGNERLDALFAESGLGPDATEAQLVGMLDKILADIEKQIDDIDALDAPDDLASDVDAWLTESRATAADVRSGGAVFFDQQASGVNPFADVNAKALELGFDACAG